MTLVERLRAYGQHYEICNEALAEIERLEAEVARLNDGLGQLAVKATEVELAIVELKKANDELGLVLNPSLSFAEVRRELDVKRLKAGTSPIVSNTQEEVARSFAQIRDEMKRQAFG